MKSRYSKEYPASRYYTEQGIYLKTLRQLVLEDKYPLDINSGIELFTNQYHGRVAIYYDLNKTREITQEEKDEFFRPKKEKQERIKR